MSKTKNNKCPSGGEFGVNCDRYENCDDCPIYDDCAEEQERLGIEPEAVQQAEPEPEEAKFIKGWDKWLEAVKNRHCKGIINGDCKDCKYFNECFPQFKKVVQLPFRIIEGELMQLTGTQLKLFLFLAYRADFSPKSNNFGRCSKVSNEQITAATGIYKTNISRFLTVLEKAGLIVTTITRKSDKGQYSTYRTIHISFYKKNKELKKWKVQWDKLDQVAEYNQQ